MKLFHSLARSFVLERNRIYLFVIDVVARRRLRAGRSQISLATRAAKSKRIELEHYMPNATAKIALKDRKNKSAHKTRGGEKNRLE